MSKKRDDDHKPFLLRRNRHRYPSGIYCDRLYCDSPTAVVIFALTSHGRREAFGLCVECAAAYAVLRGVPRFGIGAPRVRMLSIPTERPEHRPLGPRKPWRRKRLNGPGPVPRAIPSAEAAA